MWMNHVICLNMMILIQGISIQKLKHLVNYREPTAKLVLTRSIASWGLWASWLRFRPRSSGRCYSCIGSPIVTSCHAKWNEVGNSKTHLDMIYNQSTVLFCSTDIAGLTWWSDAGGLWLMTADAARRSAQLHRSQDGDQSASGMTAMWSGDVATSITLKVQPYPLWETITLCDNWKRASQDKCTFEW